MVNFNQRVRNADGTILSSSDSIHRNDSQVAVAISAANIIRKLLNEHQWFKAALYEAATLIPRKTGKATLDTLAHRPVSKKCLALRNRSSKALSLVTLKRTVRNQITTVRPHVENVLV